MGGHRRTHRELIIFGREPVPGKVKTRLAASVGDAAATQLYRAFLLDTIDRVRPLTEEVRVFMAMAAGRSHSGLEFPTPWPEIFPQVGEGLGQRMHNAFSDSFDRGFKSVCLIGSDTPTLPTGLIRRAFEEVRPGVVVLGPSEDGGYYLIGLASPQIELFQGVRYGTDRVLRDTCRIAERVGLEVTLLGTWYDVDDADDLARLIQEVGDGGRGCERTRATLAELHMI
jgi:rSAM/selenodomain-associated transferase 1